MAEIKDPVEPALHAKRKPDLVYEDAADCPNKCQKLKTIVTDSSTRENCQARGNNQNPEDLCQNSLASEEKNGKYGEGLVAEEADKKVGGDDGEYEDGHDDYEEDDGREKLNGNEEVDRKGKGIMSDKGKGKLIEEDDDDEEDEKEEDDDDDSEDDSGGSGSELDGDCSELSDDPLAEVDLDNILPSRTRKRTFQPGVYIAADAEPDDDDSDDSDA